ncbi:histidine kinase [Paenibacillus sp. N3.4]|uniref:ATP-binding protein n=1 Tax=Paenibacillus sp. N3.4 TaxID=2603222 RepID=UPI00164F300C|nr:sensor histidine kinase [Paenibacillus sp. N3.4]
MFKKQRGPFDLWFLWFVYLIFPIMTLITQPLPQRWIGFALLAVFSIVLTLAFKDSKRRLLYISVTYVIIGIFSTVYSPYLIYMFFYMMPLLSMLPTTKQFIIMLSGLLLTVIVIILLDFNLFYGEGLWYFLPSLVVMLVLPFGIRAKVRANDLKEKLNLANDEIARLAAMDERQRISRDLHDTLGHTLSLITLKSELAEKLMIKQPERALQEVKDIQATSRAALKQVRVLISGMHAISIDDEIERSKEILSTAGIAFKVEGSFGSWQAPPLVQNILGMCLREAVTNVIKHSGATACMLMLHEEDAKWMITITDNGPVCNENKASSPSSGRGLLGMKERLELIEGTIAFHRGSGSETRLVIQVPRIIRHQQAKGGENR